MTILTYASILPAEFQINNALKHGAIPLPSEGTLSPSFYESEIA